jgi:hypothetical protein
VNALGGPCDEAARRAVATVATGAVTARVTAVTPIARTMAAAEPQSVPAVAGASTEQAGIAAVAAVETVAPISHEQAGIPAITVLPSAATRGVVGETVAAKQSRIRVGGRTVAEENIQARSG